MNKSSFLDQYAPQSLEDLLLPRETILSATRYLNSFGGAKPSKKILLLHGVSGTGKTSFAKVLAKSSKIECVHINCSTERKTDEFKELISEFFDDISITGGKNLILLDEFDGQHNFIGITNFLIEKLKNPSNPIVMTCNTTMKIPKDFITRHCVEIKFKRIHKGRLRKKILELSTERNVKIPDETIEQLCSNGDIRYTMNALQIYFQSGYVVKDTKKVKNIFDATRFCLTQKIELPTAFNIQNVLAWVEENGFLRAIGIDRYNFYNTIKEITYLLQNYRIEEARKKMGLIVCSFSYIPDENEYIDLHRSSYVTRKYFTKNKDEPLNSIKDKISIQYPLSTHDTELFIIPLIKRMSKINLVYAKDIITKYNLTKDEIAFLMDTTPSDPMITKLLTPTDFFINATPKSKKLSFEEDKSVKSGITLQKEDDLFL